MFLKNPQDLENFRCMSWPFFRPFVFAAYFPANELIKSPKKLFPEIWYASHGFTIYVDTKISVKLRAGRPDKNLGSPGPSVPSDEARPVRENNCFGSDRVARFETCCTGR